MADRKLANAKVLAHGSIAISLCSLVVLVVAVTTDSTLFLIFEITLFLVAGLLIASAFFAPQPRIAPH